MDRVGEHHDEMWDEEDGFFYDLLRLPDGGATRLKVRSMVGLLPLCASTVFDKEVCGALPFQVFSSSEARKFLRQHPELLTATMNPPGKLGAKVIDGCSRFSMRPRCGGCCRKCWMRMNSPSPYGIRSLSKYHSRPPVISSKFTEKSIAWTTCLGNPILGMFGGNSNWRGPVWMPVKTF